jgi:hypothetical protein
LSTLDGATHVVQLALTPIFLLTGLAQMLNVFTARLGRVADRVNVLAKDADGFQEQLQRLVLRSRILDVAVLLAALAGALTCGAALTLFLGALRNRGHDHLLFGLFGSALACLVLALAAFSVEMILSGRTVRDQANGSDQRPPPSD